jgi:hypothetical protein
MERPCGVLTEQSNQRTRLRDTTRTDWRILLGIGPDSVVRTTDADDGHLRRALGHLVASVGHADVTPAADRAHAHRSPGARTNAGADWIFLSRTGGSLAAPPLRDALDQLKPGGHIVVTLENPRGLHWVADWRPAKSTAAGGDTALQGGYRACSRLLGAAGATDVRSFALLPHHEAPRAIIPVDPPCPARAQLHAVDQVWQRATPMAALARKVIAVLITTGAMRALYPHYLVVGTKPCSIAG